MIEHESEIKATSKLGCREQHEIHRAYGGLADPPGNGGGGGGTCCIMAAVDLLCWYGSKS